MIDAQRRALCETPVFHYRFVIYSVASMRDRSLTAITEPERRFAEHAPVRARHRGPSSADRDLQCRAEVANRPTASAHGKPYCERRPKAAGLPPLLAQPSKWCVQPPAAMKRLALSRPSVRRCQNPAKSTDTNPTRPDVLTSK